VGRRSARTQSAPLWTTRCITFAIPVDKGDRVLVVGGHPGVTRALDAAGAHPVSVLRVIDSDLSAPLVGDVLPAPRNGRLAVDDAWADHVLVPVLSEDIAELFPTELTRVVRPGGTLFVAAPSKLHQRRSPAAHSLAGARRLLEGSGFAGVQSYGIRQSMHRPRYLVPLSSAEALRWFYDAAHLPRSRYGALAARALRALPSRRVHMLLFPAFGFTGVRRAEPSTAA
jgi:hypothetical protein